MPKKNAHKKSWKTTTVDSKKKKQNKLAFIVLGIVIGVLLLGQAIKFVDNLFEPITKSAFVLTNFWDGNSNLNLVLRSKDITVLSYDPFEKKVSLVNIPQETYVDVPGGYGKWQVRSIFDLGQTGKTPKGDKLLADSMSSLLGLPIDGVIDLNTLPQTPYDFVKDLKNNPFSAVMTIGKISSSLTKIEFLSLAYSLTKVRLDKITNLDLGNFNLLSKKTISDGTTVLVAEPLLLDNFIIDKFSESKIRQEQISIAVFNGTSTPGLAQKVARIITNMGGDVIISTNATAQFQKTFITSSLTNKSYTLDRLVKIFNLGCSNRQNCDKIPNNEVSSRAQVNLVLGEDFALK